MSTASSGLGADAERALRPILLLLAALVLSTYGLARSAIESLFVEAYGATRLPWATLAVVVAMPIAVTLYGRVAARRNLAAVFSLAALVSAALLALLIVGAGLDIPGSTFLLYVWKDVYIVVLVEIFWTIANSVYALGSARRLYGVFGIMGTAGDGLGGLLGASLVPSLGTLGLLWVVVPLLALVGLLCARLHRLAAAAPAPAVKPPLGASLGVVWRSSYLVPLLLLIATVQVSITLVDFRYNEILAATYPDLDERTRIGNYVVSAFSAGAVLLHLLTPWILGAFGAARTFIAIPVVLLATVTTFLLVPSFLWQLVVKVQSKAVDYSLFRNAKETLYIPLSRAERTLGKGIVDMLTYRVAKGGASFLRLALPAVLVGPALFALVCIWIGLAFTIVRRRARLEVGAAMLVLGLLCTGSAAHAAEGRTRDLPEGTMDHSAYRLDAEIFGFNKTYDEMGVLQCETYRNPRGQHRGECVMLIYDLGSTVPKLKVDATVITQVESNDPLPILPVEDWHWTVDYDYTRLWGKRLSKKRPAGAMRIEPLIDYSPTEPGICTPVVGFLLEHRGEKRYQPHLPQALKASCSLLAINKTEIMWVKSDVGAVLLRFNSSPNPEKNEKTARLAWSTAFSLARPLTFGVAVRDFALRKKAKALLGKYGKVQELPVPDKSAGRLAFSFAEPDLAFLAFRLARESDGANDSLPSKLPVDLLVSDAPGSDMEPAP